MRAVIPPWLLPLIASPFIGSFVGTLIRRLPSGRPVGLARSACETCGHVLAPAEMVPVVSFLALGGKCRHCGAPISRFHVAIEVVCVAVPLWAISVDAGDAAWLWSSCLLGWTLLALAVIDWTSWRLPDVLTLPLVVAGLLLVAVNAHDELTDSLAGAVVGYCAFRGVAIAYRALRGREGMGEGDAKLLAAGGAWLGLSALPWVIVTAALFGLALALPTARRTGAPTSGLAIPFGPALALAIWLIWLYRDALGF